MSVNLDANGNAAILDAAVDGGSSDNCEVVSLMASPTDFSCADVSTASVTLMVFDAQENFASCAAVASVSDNVPPNAVCQDVFVPLDGSGGATVLASEIDNGIFDV